MQRRFRICTHSAVAAGALLLGFVSLSVAQWSVTTPPNSSTFLTTAKVSGSGAAPGNNLPARFSFTYFDDVMTEKTENDKDVTSYEMMPGVFRWQTAANDLAAPAGGWKKTVLTMGQNGQMDYKYRHYANIIFGTGAGNFNYTWPHIVN